MVENFFGVHERVIYVNDNLKPILNILETEVSERDRAKPSNHRLIVHKKIRVNLLIHPFLVKNTDFGHGKNILNLVLSTTFYTKITENTKNICFSRVQKITHLFYNHFLLFRISKNRLISLKNSKNGSKSRKNFRVVQKKVENVTVETNGLNRVIVEEIL